MLRGGGSIASFLLGVQLARFLMPEGFGLYAIAIAFAQMMCVVAQAGLPTLAVREIAVGIQARDWSLVREAVHWFPRVTSIASALVTAAFLAGVWLYNSVSTAPAPRELVYAAILTPLFAMTVLNSAELRGFGKVVAGQFLDILLRPALVCLLLFAVYLIEHGLTPSDALAVYVAASVLTLALGLLWRRHSIPAEVRVAPLTSHRRHWTKAAVPLAASDIFQQLTTTYGLFIVGLLSPPAEAGFLRVAWGTIVVIATPLAIFNVVLAPRLAQLHAAGNLRDLQRMVAFAAAAMSLVTWCALLFLYRVGQPLLELVFGEAYAQSWAPLLLLTAGQSIVAFFGVGWVLLSVAGGERKLALAYAVSTATGILVAIILAPHYGAVGAGWAALAGNVILSVMCWVFVRRDVGVDASILGLFRVHRTPA